MHSLKRLLDSGIRIVGGKERAKIIALFACVFGLDGADKGAVGSMAVPLEHAFHIGKTDIGLLLTVSLGAGALATLLFGALVDRFNRVRLLSWTILLWAAAMVLSGFSTSYLFLLLTRILLGGVTACAAPAIASLVGDYFLQEERGRIYGYILGGEIVGTGVGFLLAGELGGWIWRAGFIVLGLPAIWLAWAIHRVREPKRGGGDRLEPQTREAKEALEKRKIQEITKQQRIEARRDLLFEGDASRKSLWWSVKYVLRIPTNLVLIIASALGYFYFAGMRTFGIQYLHEWFHVSHESAVALIIVLGIGGIVGVLVAGRLADRWIARGHVRARVAVAAGAYLLTVAFFVPALFTSVLWLGMVLLFCGAAMLGAMNPPLDAARLDIMVPGLWGRAESVRIFLRLAGEAISPLAFGYVAEHLLGSNTTSGRGLHLTFLFMLITLAAAGAVALIGLRTYPRDVATALENERKRGGEKGAAA